LKSIDIMTSEMHEFFDHTLNVQDGRLLIYANVVSSDALVLGSIIL